jgi:hypothetical protein
VYAQGGYKVSALLSCHTVSVNKQPVSSVNLLYQSSVNDTSSKLLVVVKEQKIRKN